MRVKFLGSGKSRFNYIVDQMVAGTMAVLIVYGITALVVENRTSEIIYNAGNLFNPNPSPLENFDIIFFSSLFENIFYITSFIPYAFSHTGHIGLTLGLSLVLFIGWIIVGIKRLGMHYLALFIPHNCPKWLFPLMIVIEILPLLRRKTTKQIFLDRFEVQDSKAGDYVFILGLISLGFFLILVVFEDPRVINNDINGEIDDITAGTAFIYNLVKIDDQQELNIVSTEPSALTRAGVDFEFKLYNLEVRDDLVFFFPTWGILYSADLYVFLMLYNIFANDTVSQYPADYAQLELVKIGAELLKHGNYEYLTTDFIDSIIEQISHPTMHIRDIKDHIEAAYEDINWWGGLSREYTLLPHVIKNSGILDFVPTRHGGRYADIFYTSESVIPRVKFAKFNRIELSWNF